MYSKYKSGKNGSKGELQEVATGKVLNGKSEGSKDLKGNSDGNRRREEEREGGNGDLPGYTPTPEDLFLQEAYGYWVHTNDGGHLIRVTMVEATWKTWW